MAVPNGAEARLYFSVGGQLCINAIGLRVTTPPIFNQALADLLGSGIKGDYTSFLAAQNATTTQLVRVGIRDLRTDNQPEFRDTGAAVPGTSIGDPLPPQVALCITKRTARAGRSFRGRFYATGFSETQNGSTGAASQAAADAVLAFVQNIGTVFSGSGMVPAIVTKPQEEVIITQTTNHAGGTTEVRTLSHQTAKPGNTEVITSYESRNLTWETQRRRNNGRGPLVSTLLGGTVVPAHV